LMFLGFQIELIVERVLIWDEGPAISCARDLNGAGWLIVRVDKNPAHLAWLCAPVSERAIESVACCRATAMDAVRHSRTGPAELVVVHHGRAIPEQCLLCENIDDVLVAITAEAKAIPDRRARARREAPR
jgi:hypothetical protein